MKFAKLQTTIVVTAFVLLVPVSLVAVQTTVSATEPVTNSHVSLRLAPSGVAAKLGGYLQQQLDLSRIRPTGIAKLPPDLVDPEYGEIKIAGAPGAVFHVIVDIRPAKPSRLFVDTNGNGDLTDDPPAEWAAFATPWVEKGKITETGPQGQICQTYQGGASVELGTTAAPFAVHLRMYRFDEHDPQQGGLHGKLFYYSDYAREADVVFGGKPYHVMLLDQCTTGDFRSGLDPKKAAGVRLFVDRNGNGRPDGVMAELYDVDSPFNIGGTTYELRDIPKDGSSFRLILSDKVATERPPISELAVGKLVPIFRAKTWDGAEVNFPGDYRGKVILLDFWATYCVPCMADMTQIAGTYQKFHDKGFEVLGVTLDDAGSPEPIRKAMADHRMVWPEIFDGPDMQGPVGRLYGIEAIPAPFLVDGDTGKLIATSEELRSGQIQAKVEAALAKKNSAKAQ